MRALEFINEGINDPAIFKVVFVIGGPGSGKSFVTRQLGLQALGYVNINSDIAFEYLMKKHNIDPKMPPEEKERRDTVRQRAKDITGDKSTLAIDGRLGIVIDGTGDDFEKVSKLKSNFDILGYNNFLVVVNTQLDVARERNQKRQRTVPDNIVVDSWYAVQNNIGKFSQIFEHISVIDNSGDVGETSGQIQNAYKKLLKFTKQEPNKPAAKKWMQQQLKEQEEFDSNSTTLSKLYNGDYPDRDEIFWDYVGRSDLDKPLTVGSMPHYKLKILLLSQYRAEHPDELVDLLDSDQKRALRRHLRDVDLSNNIIVISGDRVVDGNHRALAAVLSGKPIKYVDLADLDDVSAKELEEACWSGYHKEGMKTMFGKRYPNCVKNKKKKANEGQEGTLWRVEGSVATSRFFVVKGYNKSRKVWKNKYGAGDFNDRKSAQAQADKLNSVGGVRESGSKLRESKLITDVPNESWLKGKIDYAKSKGRDSYGVPYMNATTAYVRPDVRIPVDILKGLPGMRGEQKNVRQGDLKAIMKIMRDTGKLPLGRDGEEYAPFVLVAHNGEAWVSEGNHRIMAAAALGWDSLPVELKYFDGGERIESGALYPGKIGLGGAQGVAEETTALKLSPTSEKAKAWIEKVYALFPGTWQNNHVMLWGEGEEQQMAMFELVPSMSKRGAVDVKWFQAYPLRQGVGSRGMKILQGLAQEDGITLTLYPWDKGQISQAKLIKFYKSHGFKPLLKGTKTGNMIWEPQSVSEGTVDETTEQFYNLVEWKKAARKLKMHIRVGYMAGTKGVKIYEAETEDQLSGGRFFAGPGWNYGHMTVVKNNVDEMALSTYKTMGDFSKPGPFTGADKKLVPHQKNIEKATKFFERTPYDFRLFFSHLKGTGKYSEHGPMSPDQIKQVFGQDAEEIINGSEDAITVVYVGNKGDSKVMLTPWMMAHRFGHAIQAGSRNKNWTAWGEAEKYFFQTVNNLLDEHYGKVPATKPAGRNILYQLEPEYNALFNAMGTQRSSTSGQIRRPYEFLYELFAQYLGTGKVTLNPLPTNLIYGRKVFGNPTKYMNIKPEYRDEGERKQAADSLAYTMELLFNDVLGDSVGKIFVM